jgi:hypothetical protein
MSPVGKSMVGKVIMQLHCMRIECVFLCCLMPTGPEDGLLPVAGIPRSPS